MTGTPENPLLNLGIPKGEKGDPGEGSEAEPYELPIMSDTQLGGGKAVSKTTEDVPVAVDPETGRLYVPPYPESGETTVQQMQNTNTTVTLQPNVLYLFPEMSGWLRDEYDILDTRKFDTFQFVSPEEKEELAAILKEWEGRTFEDLTAVQYTEEELEATLTEDDILEYLEEDSIDLKP